MHRVEGANNVVGLFTDGPPATTLPAEWLNAVQEEIVNCIESAGIGILGRDTDTRDQLYDAIQALAAFASGTLMLFGSATPPVGWTRFAGWQDNAMLCYGQAGAINSGGGVNPQSTHTHPFTQPNNHANHAITQPTFTGPSHYHTLATKQSFNNQDTQSGVVYDQSDGDKKLRGTDFSAGALDTYWVSADTDSAGTGACTRTQDVALDAHSAHAGGTVNANTAPHYQEVIAATKD